jgi:hypothetical protein
LPRHFRAAFSPCVNATHTQEDEKMDVVGIVMIGSVALYILQQFGQPEW